MKKIIMATVIATFMVCAMAVPALSQTVGIAVGDHFTYEGYARLTEQVGNRIAKPSWLISWTTGWNNTDQVTRTVTAISGTTITFNVTTTYDNGTAPVSTSTDETIFSGYNRWVIGANMSIGDVIGQLGATSEDLLLTEESTWTWTTGVTRDVISAGWVLDSTTYSNTYKNHYDKATGIIVAQELNLTLLSGSDSAKYEVYYILVDTNRWVIPEFPTGTVMLLMFVAVAATVEIYRRKKN